MAIGASHQGSDPDVTGCFIGDTDLGGLSLIDDDGDGRIRGFPPDHIFLWRLLVHRRTGLLGEWPSAVTPAAAIGRLLRALPSDIDLLTAEPGERVWTSSRDIGTAARRKWTAEQRIRALALGAQDPETDPEWEQRAETALTAISPPLLDRPYDVTRALLFEFDRGGGELESPVPLGRLAAACAQAGSETTDWARRLAALGIPVASGRLPLRPDHTDARLLSRNLDGEPPWVRIGEPWTPGRILVAATATEASPEEVRGRLTGYGVQAIASLNCVTKADTLIIRALDDHMYHLSLSWDLLEHPLMPYQVFVVADDIRMGVTSVASRLEALGLPLLTPAGGYHDAGEDRDLLGLFERWPNSDWIGGVDQGVPLAALLAASRRTGWPIQRVCERMRELGLTVASMEETISRALERLPPPL